MIELPMVVDLPGCGRFSVDIQPSAPDAVVDLVTSEPRRFLAIVGECSVDTSGLRLEKDVCYSDPEETVHSQAIACPEIDQLFEGASCVCGAISFATGAALELSTLMGFDHPNHFVPESTEDKRVLEELGTWRVRVPLAGPGHVEIFGDVRVNGEMIRALAMRQIPSVYQDVLGSKSPAVRFRALWRVLEFAFQAHGRDLVNLLVEFPPTHELGFDRRELEDLRALRGRLSHAASRHGISEISRANAEAIASLGRLWSLVDWVTLSKKEAGTSLEVEKIQPLAAFINEQGAVQTAGQGPGAEEWVHTWSRYSSRFRS